MSIVRFEEAIGNTADEENTQNINSTMVKRILTSRIILFPIKYEIQI